jgi:hypothetical protein
VVLSALEQRLLQLEDAFNTNTKVFSDGMQMLEAENAILRRVAQDLYTLVTKGVRTPDDPVQTTADNRYIDFTKYLRQYVQALADAEAADGSTSSIVSADEDSPIIFGGNA